MDPHRRALIQIHFCVVLWGFTAILGKLITLPALALVWWRMLLVTAALACFPRVWRALRGIPPRLALTYAGIGCLVALHWLAFYGSVKLANASVAATCMALAPVVTALIEPWLTGSRFERHNLLLGVLVIPGVALVVGGIPRDMHLGFWVGVASAALAAVFNALNKRHLGHHDAAAVTWLELGAGFLLLALLGPLMAPAGSVDCPARCPRRGIAAGAGDPVHADSVRAGAGGAAASVRVHHAAGGQPGAGLRHRHRRAVPRTRRASSIRRSSWAWPSCWPRSSATDGCK